MITLNEMTRFGSKLRCGKEYIDIELHGGKDRIYPPHIHIYHTAERKNKTKLFTIEVNLAYFMCSDVLIPCRIYDKKKSIDRKDSINTSWDRYHSYHETLDEFLRYGETEQKYCDCIDNIDAAIKIFNDEADMTQLRFEDSEKVHRLFGFINKEDKFLTMIYLCGMKIKRKFRKYFTDEQLNRFKIVFE